MAFLRSWPIQQLPISFLCHKVVVLATIFSHNGCYISSSFVVLSNGPGKQQICNLYLILDAFSRATFSHLHRGSFCNLNEQLQYLLCSCKNLVLVIPFDISVVVVLIGINHLWACSNSCPINFPWRQPLFFSYFGFEGGNTNC